MVVAQWVTLDAGMLLNFSLIRIGALTVTAAVMVACQSGDNATSTASNTARSAFVGPMQCAIDLPSGPPAKPERMAAFGTATAWNVGKNLGRGAIAGAGTMMAGPVGGAVAGTVAARAIPSEFDLRGKWTATDGAPTCGCSLTLAAQSNWSGANPPKGVTQPSGCGNPLLATASDWRLDETMTGLDAELLIYAANGNRIASLTRDGADYYSGKLSDGTALTLWRP